MTSYTPRAGVDARTWDGQRAVIVRTDGRPPYSVFGYVSGTPMTWTPRGEWSWRGKPHDLDLVSDWEPAETAPEPVAPSPSTEQIAKAWMAGMAPEPGPERAKVGDRIRFTVGSEDRIATVDDVEEHSVSCTGSGFFASIRHGDYTILERAPAPEPYSRADVEELVAAARSLYEDDAEYMRINHLGDPDGRHSLRWIRKALRPFLPTCPSCGQTIGGE